MVGINKEWLLIPTIKTTHLHKNFAVILNVSMVGPTTFLATMSTRQRGLTAIFTLELGHVQMTRHVLLMTTVGHDLLHGSAADVMFPALVTSVTSLLAFVTFNAAVFSTFKHPVVPVVRVADPGTLVATVQSLVTLGGHDNIMIS